MILTIFPVLCSLQINMLSLLILAMIIGSSSGRATKSDLTIFDNNSIPHSKQQHNNNTYTIPDQRSLKRVFLSNRTISCNDGSQAGFYLRRSLNGSKRWVV